LRPLIVENRLFVPSVSQLNDPADGRPKLAALSEKQTVEFLYDATRNPTVTSAAQDRQWQVLRHNVKRHGPDTIRRIMAELLNEHFKDYGIYSLSKRYDNLSLWAKYAANHSGYCLEFVNKGPVFERSVEVIYGNTIPMDVTNLEHRTGYFLYCKRQDWSNEEEVRLVVVHGGGRTITIEPQWLTRLILGERMTDSNQQIVRQWARQRQPELRVVNAYFDELHQELRLRE
jgi:hypothetical protein